MEWAEVSSSLWVDASKHEILQTRTVLTYWVTCWDKEGHQDLFSTSFMNHGVSWTEQCVNPLHELFSHSLRNKYFSRGSFWLYGFLLLCYADALHVLPSKWSYNTGLRKDGFICVCLVDFHITWIELLLSLDPGQYVSINLNQVNTKQARVLSFSIRSRCHLYTQLQIE